MGHCLGLRSVNNRHHEHLPVFLHPHCHPPAISHCQDHPCCSAHLQEHPHLPTSGSCWTRENHPEGHPAPRSRDQDPHRPAGCHPHPHPSPRCFPWGCWCPEVRRTCWLCCWCSRGPEPHCPWIRCCSLCRSWICWCPCTRCFLLRNQFFQSDIRVDCTPCAVSDFS